MPDGPSLRTTPNVLTIFNANLVSSYVLISGLVWFYKVIKEYVGKYILYVSIVSRLIFLDSVSFIIFWAKFKNLPVWKVLQLVNINISELYVDIHFFLPSQHQ